MILWFCDTHKIPMRYINMHLFIYLGEKKKKSKSTGTVMIFMILHFQNYFLLMYLWVTIDKTTV